MSIEQQLERLNANLEALVGAIVANTSVSKSAAAADKPVFAASAEKAAATGGVSMNTEPTNAGATATEAEPAAGKDEKRGPGRPKTRYYRADETGVAIKTSGDAPEGRWTEISKAEYDKANNAVAASTKPAAKAEPTPEPAADSASDPFADDEPATPAKQYTLDDVREVALKLRDKTSMDDAKAFIATFGVAKVADLPQDKFGDFIAKANEKLTEAEL